MKLKVFVASSVEGLDLAYPLQDEAGGSPDFVYFEVFNGGGV